MKVSDEKLFIMKETFIFPSFAGKNINIFYHSQWSAVQLTILGRKGALTFLSSNASQSILSWKKACTDIARSPPCAFTQPRRLVGFLVINWWQKQIQALLNNILTLSYGNSTGPASIHFTIRITCIREISCLKVQDSLLQHQFNILIVACVILKILHMVIWTSY